MTATSPDPGATAPTTTPPARALAPDLARGTMLLLIVLSNTALHLWAATPGAAGWHPAGGSVADRAVQFAMIVGLDLRVYPVFAFLFGYGLWWSYRRRLDAGASGRASAARVRRRCWWLLVLGAVHAGLFMAGDILGAYGLLGLVLAWVLLRRSDRVLVIAAGVLGVLLIGLLVTGGLLQGLAVAALGPDAPASPAPASTELYAAGIADPGAAMLARITTWIAVVPFGGVLTVVSPLAAVLGILAARHRVLEDPASHRRLLVATAAVGIPVGWAGGVPAALGHVSLWPVSDAMLAESGPFFVLALTSGIAAGLGYVAALTLLSRRWRAGTLPTPVRAVRAMGARSMSTYLAHSVLFAPLLAAWGLGLGAHLSSATVALVAIAVWLITAALALRLEDTGRPGPAEALLRLLVDGREPRVPHRGEAHHGHPAR